MLCGLAALVALAVLVASSAFLPGRCCVNRQRRADHRPASPRTPCSRGCCSGCWPHMSLAAGNCSIDRSRHSLAASCFALALLGAVWPRSKRSRNRFFTTLIPSGITLATLLLVPTPIGGLRLLQTATTPAVLHAYFPHENHRTVNCIACHHNYVDKTGFGSCYDCHRSARTDLPQVAEATFHEFCRDCHSGFAREHGKHGPVRECSGCHVESAAAGALSNNTPICQTWRDAKSCSRGLQAADAWGFR